MIWNVLKPGSNGLIPSVSSESHLTTPELQGCVKLVYPACPLGGASFLFRIEFQPGRTLQRK
jgi:hypothetical protein